MLIRAVEGRGKGQATAECVCVFGLGCYCVEKEVGHCSVDRHSTSTTVMPRDHKGAEGRLDERQETRQGITCIHATYSSAVVVGPLHVSYFVSSPACLSLSFAFEVLARHSQPVPAAPYELPPGTSGARSSSCRTDPPLLNVVLQCVRYVVSI